MPGQWPGTQAAQAQQFKFKFQLEVWSLKSLRLPCRLGSVPTEFLKISLHGRDLEITGPPGEHLPYWDQISYAYAHHRNLNRRDHLDLFSQ